MTTARQTSDDALSEASRLAREASAKIARVEPRGLAARSELSIRFLARIESGDGNVSLAASSISPRRSTRRRTLCCALPVLEAP
jgi:hypothetical protein